MDRGLINKKNRILSIVGREVYYAILRFLEVIYLSNYDLKIFKARKMSNLYLALKELLLAEDGGRVRKLYKEKKFTEEPIIIADWALDYLDIAYPNRTITRVLLIDDIIIHGRTLANLYDSVEERFEGVFIDVKTYAKNIEDHLDHPAIKNASAEDIGTIEKCRKYSQTFVDIFMAMNQPYTSYVPNIAIRLTESNNKEECVKKDLDQFIGWMKTNRAVNNSYDDVKVKIPFYETNVWSSKGEFENILFNSIRTYLNKESDEYAVVPMVSMKPVSQDTLKNQLKILTTEKIFRKPFAERWMNSYAKMGTMDYRALVYSVSTLWGRYFFTKEKQFESLINRHEFELFEEELMSFGKPLLNREVIGELSENQIRNLLNRIADAYEPVETDIFTCSSSEIRELNRIMDEDILPNFPDKKSRKDWEHIIRDFLHRDSEEDEKHWNEWKKNHDQSVHSQQKREHPRRIPGLPIVMIVEKAKEDMQVAFEEILKAIDHGEGSIVPEQFISNSGDVFFVSSLHAGEQNYKYFEQKYYSWLYGMYQIEREAEPDRRKYQKSIRLGISDSQNNLRLLENHTCEKKKNLLEKCGMSHDMFLQEMTQKSVTDEYGSPLDLDFYMYANDESLAKAIAAFYELTRS